MKNVNETTARGILTIGGQVLLAKGKQDGFSHLPGGHVEAGETPQDAVVRELREETGRIVSRMQPIGALDNIYDRGNTRVHEEIHLFKIWVYPALIEVPPRSQEDWLDFFWCPIQDLGMPNINLQPTAVRDYVAMYGGI